MGSITLNKPSGGQLTISPEDGATNETVTIPSVGVGKVLQVVSNYITDASLVTNTTSSYIETGVSLTFTPKSTSSTILIKVVATFRHAGNNAGINFRLYKDGTQMAGAKTDGMINQSDSSIPYAVVPLSAEYTPSSLTSTTVDLRFASRTNGTASNFKGDTSTAYIEIMEVAA